MTNACRWKTPKSAEKKIDIFALMTGLFCLLLFVLTIVFFVAAAMKDAYIYLYSPQKLLIKRNPSRSLSFLLGGTACAGFVSVFLFLTDTGGWRNFIPFIFVLLPLCYHLYCVRYGQFMTIDQSTGEIEISDVRKIKITDILYLELYSFRNGGYTYDQLCFVVQTLRKVDIHEEFLGMEAMIKELSSFLNKECKDNRD